MKIFRRLLAAAFGMALLATTLPAQDPSDLFLRAYQDFQAGEKFERDASPREALEKYRNAARLLEEIAKVDATWQPPVVDYRLKKTRENIERLEPVVATLPELPAGPEGELPTRSGDLALPPPVINTTRPLASEPTPGAAPPRRTTPSSSVPSGGGSELANLRRQLSEVRRDNERLQAELSAARTEIDRTKVTVVELRAQLAQAQDAYENALRDRPAAPAAEDPRLKELSDRIVAAEADNEVLLEENERLLAKLEDAAKYIQASDSARKTLDSDRKKLADQRDEAIARTKRIKDNTERIEKLTAEKAELEKKLAEAGPKRLAELTEENKQLANRLAEAEQKLTEALKLPDKNEAVLTALRSEVNSLNDRLLEAQAQVSARDEQITALMAQLDESAGEVARLRLTPEPTAEDRKVIAENELLRGIILRQIKEQTERDVARVALEKELGALQVKSESLSQQLGILSKPAFQLTEEEQELFREPVALLSEPAPETLDVSLAVAKAGEPAPQPEGAESLPDATRDMVEQARSLFDAGRFADAERLYQQIVETAPENYFALSNLGVTQIQARKLSAAEVALKKAVGINPRDAFAATNLGIVYCKQGRFDEAIEVLQEALQVDANDYIAHNYLAVCLGEKGRKGEAEEHFRRSIEIRDNYADAHFNLAVLYATAEPPALELARQHYRKATDHGAPPDLSLERLIQ
ncbi:MAG: tetratricopeptide repeat protein [Terrimicrobiaceae bacterium]|nr:tetratricopeptide repeat protein [Terrimicrobiaceae bacterium]